MKAFFKNYFFHEVYFLWGKIIQERSIFISIFDIKQKRSDFGKEISKLHSTCLEEDFEEQLILKTLQWSKIFQTFSEKFETFGAKFSGMLSKMHSTCPEELFAEKYIFEENRISVTFFGIWVKKIGLPAKKTFGKVLKIAFYVSRKTLWDFSVQTAVINFFRISSESLSHLEQKVFGFVANMFRDSCRNCILRNQRNFSNKKVFLIKKLILWLFSRFQQKLLDLVFEIALYVSKWTNWRKKCSEKKTFLLRVWAKTFWAFVEKFLAQLSKLHFTCPNEVFRAFRNISELERNVVQKFEHNWQTSV